MRPISGVPNPGGDHLGPSMRTWARSSARGSDHPHVGPMVCAWAPPPRRIPSGLRAHQGVYVRIKGLTHIFSGLRATNTPRQTPNPPKRRPIQQKQAIFSDFRPMGLHFGGHIPSSRGLAPPIGGNCTTRGSDTPATRRKKASCSAKPPTDADVGVSSVPHSGVTVWWSARLIWVRSPCDPSRKLSTSDSK